MYNKIIKFQLNKDDAGNLIAIEGNKTIPFDINRIFYIYDVPPGKRRGCHAHRNSEEVIICIKGSCVCLLDDGITKENILLESEQESIYIKKRMWIELYDFSYDCILVVLCDKHYDEADYINDYNSFLKLKEIKK